VEEVEGEHGYAKASDEPKNVKLVSQEKASII
jgi:hypothetical protein